MKVRAHVFVSGRVQGVFFRSETSRQARRRNITGWVQNLPDGRVEAVFEGEKNDVERLIEFCNTGSSMAKVTNVEIHWEKHKGEFKHFRIHYRNRYF